MTTRVLAYLDPPKGPLDLDDVWGTVTQPDDEGDCVRCGGYTDWRYCWSCGGACIHDLHDQDPLWYTGDWRYQMCHECRGEGGWTICTRGCYYVEPDAQDADGRAVQGEPGEEKQR